MEEFVILGNSISRKKIHQTEILGNTFESLVAAIYFDSNFENTSNWLSQVFDSIWPFKTFRNLNFDNKKFLDIGSGCGFPGLAYAITYPTSEIYLIDSSKKKTDALKSPVSYTHLTLPTTTSV